MDSLHVDDLVIQTPPCNAILSTGITPPQPDAFSGRGGGGSGGSSGGVNDGVSGGGGGGNSGHGRSDGGRRKGAPASFGMFPT